MGTQLNNRKCASVSCLELQNYNFSSIAQSRTMQTPTAWYLCFLITPANTTDSFSVISTSYGCSVKLNRTGETSWVSHSSITNWVNKVCDKLRGQSEDRLYSLKRYLRAIRLFQNMWLKWILIKYQFSSNNYTKWGMTNW